MITPEKGNSGVRIRLCRNGIAGRLVVNFPYRLLKEPQSWHLLAQLSGGVNAYSRVGQMRIKSIKPFEIKNTDTELIEAGKKQSSV